MTCFDLECILVKAVFGWQEIKFPTTSSREYPKAVTSWVKLDIGSDTLFFPPSWLCFLLMALLKTINIRL